LVWRRDRLPTLTVQADVTGKTLPATVIAELTPKIAQLNTTLPAGYKVVVGGTVEQSAQSQASVAAVLPIAGLLMLVVLMLQLQSFNKLFLVLSVAPFGLIGVVIALLVSDSPLGFVALLGVIALVGMIVRNSVILVEQIDQLPGHPRRQNITSFLSRTSACRRRAGLGRQWPATATPARAGKHSAHI